MIPDEIRKPCSCGQEKVTRRIDLHPAVGSIDVTVCLGCDRMRCVDRDCRKPLPPGLDVFACPSCRTPLPDYPKFK